MSLEAIIQAVRERGPDGDYADLGRINVRRRDHLLIFNYNKFATFAGQWPGVERVARGLIIDGRTGAVVARAFDKFFNVGEMPETRLDALPQEPFEVFDKADGSLGVLYRHNGEFAVATRGSFDSPQALWATAWLSANHDLTGLADDVTLLFEIIYPENRIVIDYGAWSGLILLAARRLDGTELGYDEVQALGARYGFRVAERFVMPTLGELLAATATATGVEGWIVRFASGLRVKVKAAQYLAIHRALYGITPEHVREALLGDWPAFAAGIPEEFRPEIEAQAGAMMSLASTREAAIRAVYEQLAAELGPQATRKDWALRITGEHKAMRSELFVLLKGMPLTQMLLKDLDLTQLPPRAAGEALP